MERLRENNFGSTEAEIIFIFPFTKIL